VRSSASCWSLALGLLSLGALGNVEACAAGVGSSERPNLVLIVLDDVGLENLAPYCSVAPELQPACTPNLDALAASGVLFCQAYGNPLCSPTRAQILTGRHGFRTGIGGLVDFGGSRSGLSAELERTLPEVLAGYDSSLVGKWHLAHPGTDGLQHPLASGFRFYAGSLFNLSVAPVDFGAGPMPCWESLAGSAGYTRWVKTRDAGRGVLEQTCASTYATTDTADDAIARARAMQAPWFLEVAFNAAHMPFQRPPRELCPPSDACAFQYGRVESETPADVTRAMIEALDHELGRLLAELRRIDPDVWIVVIGDNGTEIDAAVGPEGGCLGPDRVKGTLYQGGIRVPLIVSGPGVVPGVCDELVQATDLFATLCELAGVAATAADSRSLVPLLRGGRAPVRRAVYAEVFAPNFVSPDSGQTPPFTPRTHTRAVFDGRFKLLRYTDEDGRVEERLFDLAEDPCEQRDLSPKFGPADPARLTPLQAAHLRALQEELAALGVF
jgi:arylsulfatase A-like enzyme